MIEYITRGGMFMAPILACSVLTVAILLEKLWALRLPRIIPQQFSVQLEHLLRTRKIPEAIDLCRHDPSPMARILAGGIRNYGRSREELKSIVAEIGKREAALLDRFLDPLATIASVSTLLGLLGTISGMISIFGVISLQTSVNPAQLAGGISEALYTTGAGLCVAIPTLLIYRYLTGRSDTIVLQMEEFALRMIDLLQGQSAD